MTFMYNKHAMLIGKTQLAGVECIVLLHAMIEMETFQISSLQFSRIRAGLDKILKSSKISLHRAVTAFVQI